LTTCYIAPKNNYVSFIELKDLNYKGEFKQQQQKTKLNGFPFFFVHILLIGHTVPNKKYSFKRRFIFGPETYTKSEN
jgi:hypothetical protein